MKDLTPAFGSLYQPVKALLIYAQRETAGQTDYYVESYDMDGAGCPLNGHPLTVRESHALAKALTTCERRAAAFLAPKGLLPPNLLHLRQGPEGYALWYTKPQTVPLHFTENIGVASGEAAVPALIWQAGKSSLRVFAVPNTALTLTTPLFHAPFFNLYADGRVCMGNVNIRIPEGCALEDFLRLWQGYFFGSRFSHLIGGHEPVKGNIVQLWQRLTGLPGEPFPTDVLKPTRFTLQDLF